MPTVIRYTCMRVACVRARRDRGLSEQLRTLPQTRWISEREERTVAELLCVSEREIKREERDVHRGGERERGGDAEDSLRLDEDAGEAAWSFTKPSFYARGAELRLVKDLSLQRNNGQISD